MNRCWWKKLFAQIDETDGYFFVDEDYHWNICMKEDLCDAGKDYHRQAVELWNQNQFDLAIVHFEKAANADPTNVKLLINLARAHGLNFDHVKALRVKKEIKRRFGNDPYVYFMLGESDVQHLRYESAESHFRAAIKGGVDKTHRVRSYANIAFIRERLHALADSLQAAEDGIAQWPDHPRAQLAYARALKRVGDNERATNIYRDLSTRDDLAPDVKADAWYGVADQLDKEQRYDEAFDAYCQAKRAYKGREKACESQSSVIRRRNKATVAASREEIFERWQDSGELLATAPVESTAWLIGHPRSGTTLISQILDSHSKIVIADELEVFSANTFPRLAQATQFTQSESMISMLDRASVNNLDVVRNSYFEKIQSGIGEPIGSRTLIDKNPELTVLLPAICRLFPNTKILFAVRDPRDVVISCFTQALPLNPVSIDYHSIASTVEKYTTVMSGWLRLRKMICNQWMEVRYEDTVDDLETQASKVLHFLNLDFEPEVLDFHNRALSRHVHSPTYADVTKPIYTSSIGRWQRYEKYFHPSMNALRPYIDAFGYEA